MNVAVLLFLHWVYGDYLVADYSGDTLQLCSAAGAGCEILFDTSLLLAPADITIAPDGSYLMPDSGNHRIRALRQELTQHAALWREQGTAAVA